VTRILRLALLALVLAAPAAAQEAPCRPLVHEGARYTICPVDLRRAEIRMAWKRPDGAPYGSVGAAADSLRGQNLLFAVNAGMYREDSTPVGLYVEGGRTLVRANNARATGNFHLKPNGVFWVGRGRAGIVETGRYLRERPPADYATQSGPMLVIGGKIHPRITAEGPSRKRRNGVGLADPQKPVFVISEEPVSFGAFARLFRDALGCPDALFLDGSISALALPGQARLETLLPAGPVVAVFGR
jgi:uncharacterized protein YigE (DUF2233 family)